MRVKNEPFTITGKKLADISFTMSESVSSVATLTVNDAGAGYTSANGVFSFSGSATGTATLGQFGEVLGATITVPGEGYSATATITGAAPPSTTQGTNLVMSDGKPVHIGFDTTNVSAQVTIKGSLDNSTYYTLDTLSATNSFVHYEYPLKFIRADVDHWASGTLTVKALY